MTAWLLALALLLQGVNVQPQQGGTITGVLRDVAGKPFPGARVAAVAQADNPEAIREATALASIAETDADGRYRLENVPPGKYYIAAGSVSLPTFYPGTQELNDSKVVAVIAGASISAIDFQIQNTSVRGPDPFARSAAPPPALQIPIDIKIEGGGPIPVFGSRGYPRINLMGPSQSFKSSENLFLLGPTVDVVVTVENLPAGYSLKSLSFDNTDLTANNLQLSAGRYAALANSYTQNNSIAAAVISAINARVGGAASAPPPPIPIPSLQLVLSKGAPTATSGVRIRGQIAGPTIRQVYISGVPGTFYWDGSFEFTGVPSGRHSVVTFDATGRHPQAASLIVGNEDIDGIRLEPTPVLPADFRTVIAPGPAGNHAPGSTIPLATLRGTIIDKDSKKPVSAGIAFVNGHRDVALDWPDETGKFEFPKLLPGTYSVEFRLVEHVAESRVITIGDDDVNVEIVAVRPKD